MGDLISVVSEAFNELWQGLVDMSSGRITGPLMGVAVLGLVALPVVALLLRYLGHD